MKIHVRRYACEILYMSTLEAKRRGRRLVVASLLTNHHIKWCSYAQHADCAFKTMRAMEANVICTSASNRGFLLAVDFAVAGTKSDIQREKYTKSLEY